MPGPRTEGGQVTVLVATLGTMGAAGILVLLSALGVVANDRARARTAADAAALAGAAAGEAGASAATAVAGDDGGVVEDYRAEGERVTVTVRVGRARATSVAERSWQAGSARAGVG